MKWTLPVLITLLAVPAAAQKDEILFRDGSKASKVKLIEFTGANLVYKTKSGRETVPSHKVKNVTVDKWNDIYRRDNSPDDFYGNAEELLKKGNKAAAQFGYWRAGMLFLDEGKPGSAIAALEKLDKEIPESGFAPSYYVVKIQHYLSRPKGAGLKNALKVAEAYEAEAQKRGWARGFEMEAAFYQKLVKYMSGATKGPDALLQFRDLASSAQGQAEFVADMATVQVADMYRGQDKMKEAKAKYTELLKRLKALEPNVLARTMNGIGHLHWQAALKDNNAESYHKAYLSFLKTYILAKDAAPEYVGEALYYAARASDKWNGLPTSKAEAARLRARLRQREPYKSTSWANK